MWIVEGSGVGCADDREVLIGETFEIEVAGAIGAGCVKVSGILGARGAAKTVAAPKATAAVATIGICIFNEAEGG